MTHGCKNIVATLFWPPWGRGKAISVFCFRCQNILDNLWWPLLQYWLSWYTIAECLDLPQLPHWINQEGDGASWHAVSSQLPVNSIISHPNYIVPVGSLLLPKPKMEFSYYHQVYFKTCQKTDPKLKIKWSKSYFLKYIYKSSPDSLVWTNMLLCHFIILMLASNTCWSKIYLSDTGLLLFIEFSMEQQQMYFIVQYHWSFGFCSTQMRQCFLILLQT